MFQKPFKKVKKEEDNEIDAKSKRKSKKAKKQKNRKWKKRLLIVIIVAILVIGIVLGISAHRWKTLAKEMLANENSIVLDRDGNEIAKLGCERKNRTIALSDLPDNLNK